MVVRSLKHILNSYLCDLPLTKMQSFVAHFLNCVFGIDDGVSDSPITKKSLREMIVEETGRRFRYSLSESSFKHLSQRSLLRSICMRVGIQLEARDFFINATTDQPVLEANGHKKKSKKNKKLTLKVDARPARFTPDDIVCLVPVIKHSGIRVT
jgi:protein TIF31